MSSLASSLKDTPDSSSISDQKRFQLAAKDLKIIENEIKDSKSPLQPVSFSSVTTLSGKKLLEGLNQSRSEIATTFCHLIKNLSRQMQQLTDTSKAFGELQRDTSQLADYSTTIASAAEELGATINSIVGNLQNTIESSGEAKSIAADGTSIIHSTQSKIIAVNEIFEHTNESMSRLLAAANQADKIIRVVNDISSKTDLLALNASIEAARAGEAGKGFAVVAHEVSRLSEKTQDSISEIENIIENLKNEISEMSSKIKEGTNTANEANKDASKSKETISAIVEKIDYFDNEVANIGAAVQEQSQAVSDIANNIQTISKAGHNLSDKVRLIADKIDLATKSSHATREDISEFSQSKIEIIEHTKIDIWYLTHRLRRMVDGFDSLLIEDIQKLCQPKILGDSNDNQKFKDGLVELKPLFQKIQASAFEILNTCSGVQKDAAQKIFRSFLQQSEQILRKLDELMKATES